jgi:hypothetical protein
MLRALRLMTGVLVDICHWGGSGGELRIDMKRVNLELRRAALVALEEDVAYRDRVKQRIRDGARCGYPPLIDRSKVLRYGAALFTADIAS